MHLNWRITTEKVKAEPRWWTVVIVQDTSEDFSLLAEAGASSPHHLHGGVLQTLCLVCIVNPGKEEPIESHLMGERDETRWGV